MPVEYRSWKAVWASTQRWPMSLDILDWPKHKRVHGTIHSQSLSADSALNYCQILAKQQSNTAQIMIGIRWNNDKFITQRVLSSVGGISGQNCRCHRETNFVYYFFGTVEGRWNIGTRSGQESHELRQSYGRFTKERVSYQWVESRDKIVRVIAKQSLFDFFFEPSRVGKILASVQDKNQTRSDDTIVDL